MLRKENYMGIEQEFGLSEKQKTSLRLFLKMQLASFGTKMSISKTLRKHSILLRVTLGKTSELSLQSAMGKTLTSSPLVVKTAP